jgi:S-adenosylmethionine:tRNA ribosyltransferase-isomerase
MHPKDISIEDFTYHLPDERIAKYPLAERDQSKLLVYQEGNIKASIYQDLPNQLPADTLLVFNNTKVVEARLLFQKPSGGNIEIFCLEPHQQYADITTAMLQKGKVWWQCLVGGAKKWKAGALTKTIIHNENTITLTAVVVEKLADSFIIELQWDDEELCFAALLHIAGIIPLPPYLNRLAEESDKERYQTIYAKQEGSVAAPTAGLHFTERLMQALQSHHINSTYVTLHVGAGTFKPVKAEKLADHDMHTEWIDVALSTIETLQQYANQTIVPVGTTSLRTIETLYWMGVKIIAQHQQGHQQPTLEYILIKQWDAYELEQTHTVDTALSALIQWMKDHHLERLIAPTQILIAPGYPLQLAKGIITNFHQPQSTLLLLIAAFTGTDWQKIYDYALLHNFRFLSYGDGSLIWKKAMPI